LAAIAQFPNTDSFLIGGAQVWDNSDWFSIFPGAATEIGDRATE
jgi:hypothetical protein